MVFDTKTLASFSALADVVGEYTTPGKLTTPLTEDQKRDACLMRLSHNWHAHHIAEALGIRTARQAWQAEEDILEALEECALSDYWNRQQIRLQPGIQISAEGGSTYASFRTSVVKDAIARMVIANPKITAADMAKRIGPDIDRQITSGQFKGIKPNVPPAVGIAGLMKDLVALGFNWEGRRRASVMRELPENVRTLVEAEILRQCEEAQKAGSVSAARIARDVSSNFIIDERFGETMESMNYEPLRGSYVYKLCTDKGFIKPQQISTADQIADKENIAEITRLKKEDPDLTAGQVASRAGLSAQVTEGIFKNLGYAVLPQGMRPKEVRELILKAHKEERLTVTQMIEKYPQIDTYYGIGVRTASQGIHQILATAGLKPHTEVAIEAEQTEERRTPLVAAEIRRLLIEWLRDPALEEQNPAFGRNLLLRIPDNDVMAELTGESESLISAAIELLLAEEGPIIQMIGGVIQVPAHTQLRAKRGELT